MTSLLKEVTTPAQRSAQTREATAQLEQSLRDLGFTGYASRAFGAALSAGDTTAGELVVRTSIPDSKIYYALDELIERGLIEVQGGKPKRYRVGSAAEVTDRLERMLKEKHAAEVAAVRRIEGMLETTRASASPRGADLAYIVKGEENVVARATRLITQAQKDITLICSDERLLRRLEPALAHAARGGVQLRMAIPLIPLDGVFAKKSQVRQIVCSCTSLVVDSAQILTVDRGPQGTPYAIYSTDPTLVRFGLDYWESPRCCAM